MRVIAGAYGGRRLRAPTGADTRPTSDRVREALFSVLGERVAGARVLDLFAGTGALGIEALSRGASEATFVDSSLAAIRVLEANLAGLGITAQVHRADARAFTRTARRRPRQYDLVFLDPPYKSAAGFGAELAEWLPALLAPDATVVCETDFRAPMDLRLPLQDERRYGDTRIAIHGC